MSMAHPMSEWQDRRSSSTPPLPGRRCPLDHQRRATVSCRRGRADTSRHPFGPTHQTGYRRDRLRVLTFMSPRRFVMSVVMACLLLSSGLSSCSDATSENPSDAPDPQRQEDEGEEEVVRAPNGTNLGAPPINAGDGEP